MGGIRRWYPETMITPLPGQEDPNDIPFLAPMVFAGTGLVLGIVLAIRYDIETGVWAAVGGLVFAAIAGIKEVVFRKVGGTRSRD
jgi:hypothetical protein